MMLILAPTRIMRAIFTNSSQPIMSKLTVPITEAQFQQQVTGAAELTGWWWMHVDRMEMNGRWRTPITGTLGRGFPDLMLVNKRSGKIIFAELKSQRGVLSEDQRLTMLKIGMNICYVWRPSDWAGIMEVLSNA